ncbi:MAG TPA: UDP-glucose 4-epimerase GalE [Usitatibacter sp.]|nr:UDP-glucose 4-epimerase GalE [Usitatibacter sp.]
MSTVLVTGGAGFIGTHILTVLAARGHRCVVVDNYCNSSPRAIERVRALVPPGAVEAFEVDIRDADGLRRVFGEHAIDSVIHMAGLKAVGESVEQPERYHDNNVVGTRVLLEALRETRARDFVFSSSATVYGTPERVPLAEDARTAPQSPYGENKLEIEGLLVDLARRDPTWRVANLRYFNPVGAHESGTIGEDPGGIPNNLMPFVCQAAVGRRERLSIFGNDWPTPDGTGVRDYIHVLDLAEGHVAALAALKRAEPGTVMTVNLGTGRGYSVLELVEAFERVNGVSVPRAFAPRRPGDIATCYADPSLAERLLGWKARRGIEDMCRDAWNWQKKNPDGYR